MSKMVTNLSLKIDKFFLFITVEYDADLLLELPDPLSHNIEYDKESSYFT